jgi:mRNA interferase MazF
MISNPCSIKRGEIWLINLDPTLGAEIKKTRPAVVISSDGVGKLPLKVIVPITEWNDAFHTSRWHVRLDPNKANGLNKASAADAFQIRSLSIQRFVKRLGVLDAVQLEEIAQAVAIVVDL